MTVAPERRDVVFASGGEQCAAWLYLPASLSGPAPAVVLAPGLAGVRHARVDDFAADFARAGLVALVFDYRGFGDSAGRPRQVMTVRGQLADWRGAVAAVRQMPEIDPGRVALWGGSITGGHVLRVAADDPDVAAVVSHVPLVDGLDSALAVRPFPRQQLRLLRAAGADLLRGLVGREPAYLPAVGPPGSLAVLTSPDAEPDYRAILPQGWDERIAARAALALLTYRPGRSAARIACPLLVTLGSHDAITPPRRAARLAARAPAAEVRWYPVRHFESFAGPASEEILRDARAFLVRHLLPPAGERADGP